MSNPRDNIRPLHSEGGDLGARDSLERDTIALGLSETLSPDQLHRLDLIEPADFARPSYARVWEARTEVVNGGHTPTVENVAAIMDDREAWSGEVSNTADLAVIAAGVPSVNDLPAVMRSLKGARTAGDKAKAHTDAARAYLNAAEEYAYRRDAKVVKMDSGGEDLLLHSGFDPKSHNRFDGPHAEAAVESTGKARPARGQEIAGPAVQVHAVDEVRAALGWFAEVLRGGIVGIAHRPFTVAVVDRV